MKIVQIKNVTLAFLLLLTLGMAGQAQALTVGVVGTLDTYTGDNTFLAQPTEENEVDWINSVLGTDYTTVIKTEITDTTVFEEVSDDGLDNSWALEIVEADYFIIKTTDIFSSNVFLFENNLELDYAYIDLDAFNALILDQLGFELKDIESISHVSSPVPLPAAVWLFGSALLGLIGVARRRA